jgi:hypothetical protein
MGASRRTVHILRDIAFTLRSAEPLQHITLRDSGFVKKLGERQASWIDLMEKGWYGVFGYVIWVGGVFFSL